MKNCFRLLSYHISSLPSLTLGVWEKLTDKYQPPNYHPIIASIYTKHAPACGLTTCFSFSQRLLSNVMPVRGINTPNWA